MEYRTKDFYLAAYLMANRKTLKGIDKTQKKYYFIFEGENLENESMKYYNNSEIKTLDFVNGIRNLKNIMYEDEMNYEN